MLIRNQVPNLGGTERKLEYAHESVGRNLSQRLNWKSQSAFKRNLALMEQQG